MESTPEPGDGRRGFQQRLGGKGTEGTYEIGLNRRNLTFQKGKTGFDLIGFWIPVSRWATLDDIANVNLAAAEFDGFDNTGKQLTGGTDKWFSLPVLFESGSLTDEYKLGPWVTFTKYNAVSFPCQSATLTIT
jgi:hypothetical protein